MDTNIAKLLLNLLSVSLRASLMLLSFLSELKRTQVVNYIWLRISVSFELCFHFVNMQL